MPTLPPCRICGEKASGFHYGVNTCEACKAFFRRSLSKYETYVCNQNKSCELPPGRRNFCSLCRFKRCVLMGMCRNAIKTGRYTHEKKANDIKELKGMKEWSAPAEDQVQQELQERLEELQKEQQLLGDSTAVKVRSKRPREKIQKYTEASTQQKQLKEEAGENMRCEIEQNSRDNCQNSVVGSYALHFSVGSNESIFSDIPSVTDSIETVSSPLLYSPQPITTKSEAFDGNTAYSSTLTGSREAVGAQAVFSPSAGSGVKMIEDHRLSFASSSNVSAEVERRMTYLPPTSGNVEATDNSVVDSASAASNQQHHCQEQVDVLENVIKRIQEVYEANTTYTKDFLEALPEREREYVRQKQLNIEMFGPTKTMSRAEYLSVYEATGVDVDGRREMLEMALPHIELGIKRFICYVKAIPGFNEMAVDDQICLIKSTRFYCWMILSHRCFNHEHRLHACCDGRLVSAEDMAKFNDPEIVQALFDLQRKIKDLNLTDEETVTFAAFCVMSSDHHQLQRASVAEQSQELLLNCLMHLFEKHHPEDKLRLTKFIDCFLYMKSCHDENIKAEEKFASEWAGIVEFPPVMYEIWSS